MLRRFYRQFPDYAQPDHPAMRYTVLRERHVARRSTRILRWIGAFALLVILIVFGYIIAAIFTTPPLGESLINPLEQVYMVLYWPLIILQIALLPITIAVTTGIIGSEIRRGTWDTLKITTSGAGLTVRVRWFAVFHRLRYLLLLIVAARVFFVFVALVDYASFQGRYLDLLFTGTTPLGDPALNPTVALVLEVLIAAASMTASLVMPFTTVALHASIGIALGALLRNRIFGLLGPLFVILIRVLLTLVALVVGTLALSFASPLSAFNIPFLSDSILNGGLFSWLATFFGIAEGDMGLTLLHTPHLQRVWADIEYGALIGVALLVYTLLQALIAQALIRLAVWRASAAERA